MTSTKFQINYNIQKSNDQNGFGHLVIDIWNLFVICYLLFGALFTKMLDFMDRHYLNRYFRSMNFFPSAKTCILFPVYVFQEKKKRNKLFHATYCLGEI